MQLLPFPNHPSPPAWEFDDRDKKNSSVPQFRFVTACREPHRKETWLPFCCIELGRQLGALARTSNISSRATPLHVIPNGADVTQRWWRVMDMRTTYDVGDPLVHLHVQVCPPTDRLSLIYLSANIKRQWKLLGLLIKKQERNQITPNSSRDVINVFRFLISCLYERTCMDRCVSTTLDKRSER